MDSNKNVEESYHRADKLMAAYLKMKGVLEAKSKAFKDEKASIEEKQEVIKKELHRMCNQLGTTNLKSDTATAFLATKDYVSVTDWEETLAFVIAPLFPDLPEDELWSRVEQSNLHFLTKGVLKTAVKDFLEEHGTPIPGTKYESERVIQVRKGPSNGK